MHTAIAQDSTHSPQKDIGKQKCSGKDQNEWKAKSVEWCRRHKVTIGANAWTRKPAVRLEGVRPQLGALDVIDVGYACAIRGASDAEAVGITKTILCDVSENVERRPWANKFSTFTTSSHLYAYGLDRIIYEAEKNALLGFDARRLQLDNLPPHQLRDIAGDAMAVPSVALVMYSVVLNVKFPGLWSQSK